MSLQHTFNSLKEIEDYDKKGEIPELRDFSFLESAKEGKILMVFKLGDEEKFRVVRISIETFKRIRKKVREFYDFYESDLFKLPGL